MSDIRRRIKKAEDRLNLSKEPITITVTMYGGELPPDQTIGGVNVHNVAYEVPAINKSEGNRL